MIRLRKIGLWMLVVAGLLPAATLGLMILSPMILKLDTLNSLLRSPFAHALNIGVWSGPVLALVGGLLVVIGWAGEPSEGGKPGKSRVATWVGICIGAGLGFPLGVAPLFWALFIHSLDQGALIIAFTCPVALITGAVVGGILGSRRLPSAVLKGSAIGAAVGFNPWRHADLGPGAQNLAPIRPRRARNLSSSLPPVL